MAWIAKLFTIIAVLAELVLRLLKARDKQAGREEAERDAKLELDRRVANAESIDNLSLDDLTELRNKRKRGAGNVPNDNKKQPK